MSISELPTRTQVDAAFFRRIGETLTVAKQIAPIIRAGIIDDVKTSKIKLIASGQGDTGGRVVVTIPDEFRPALSTLAGDESKLEERSDAINAAIRQILLAEYRQLPVAEQPKDLTVQVGLRSHMAVIELWYDPPARA